MERCADFKLIRTLGATLSDVCLLFVWSLRRLCVHPDFGDSVGVGAKIRRADPPPWWFGNCVKNSSTHTCACAQKSNLPNRPSLRLNFVLENISRWKILAAQHTMMREGISRAPSGKPQTTTSQDGAYSKVMNFLDPYIHFYKTCMMRR
jgi:hypothetical protein